MSETRKGQCLCGAVHFEADLAEPHFHACHCSMCRKWGGPALAMPAEALRIADGAPVKAFSSSDYGERVFCADCGTHLFWRMQDHSMSFVWIGVLEDQDGLTLDTQIFIDSKPGHYALANDTTNLTAAQVMEMWGGEA